MPPSKQGPRARKALGQHFLRDRRILARIASAVRVPEGGVVVEIGGGTGELTAALLEAGHEVIVLEIERRLVEHLSTRFAGAPGLAIIEGDARTVDIGVLAGGRPFAIAGNLPYFAAAPIIRRILEGDVRPAEAVVMVQREVAHEMAAEPGRLSLFGISVQVYAEPEILFDVPAAAFDPPPKVVSSVVRLTLRPEPLVPVEQREAFFRLVRLTFRNRRKQLHNALDRSTCVEPGRAAEALASAGIDSTRRAETLAIREWIDLLDACEAQPPNA